MATGTAEALGCGAPLDPHETTVPSANTAQRGGIGEYDDLGMAFRHSGWLVDRKRVDLALVSLAVAARRIERFRACGSGAWVQRSIEHPDRLRIRSDYCHDRFCVACGTAHGRIIASRVRAWLGTRPARFVTLTTLATAEPLADRLDRLYAAFRRLRRGKWWRSRVNGGVATIEVKRGLNSGKWHPHLHVLCRGRHLPAGELSREWHVATGDSYIVDVSLVTDAGHASDYVAKYVGKPGSRPVYSDHDSLCEMMTALTGRRLLLTFGDCKLVKTPTPDEQDTWENVDTLDNILWHAQRGSPSAQIIMYKLTRSTACPTTKNRPPPPGLHQPPPFLTADSPPPGE